MPTSIGHINYDTLSPSARLLLQIPFQIQLTRQGTRLRVHVHSGWGAKLVFQTCCAWMLASLVIIFSICAARCVARSQALTVGVVVNELGVFMQMPHVIVPGILVFLLFAFILMPVVGRFVAKKYDPLLLLDENYNIIVDNGWKRISMASVQSIEWGRVTIERIKMHNELELTMCQSVIIDTDMDRMVLLCSANRKVVEQTGEALEAARAQFGSPSTA